MTQHSRSRFSARDISLITVFSVLVTLLVAITAPTLMVLTGGILPVPVWASLIWPMGGIFIRSLVNRPLTNSLSGLIMGVVGSFVLPIGVFGLIAIPAQGLVLDGIFGWRKLRATNLGVASLAGALSAALFVFLVVYVFFKIRSPFPLVAVLLGAVAGAVAGVIGSLIARRVVRVGLIADEVVGAKRPC